jgi:hypothetical protein
MIQPDPVADRDGAAKAVRRHRKRPLSARRHEIALHPQEPS